MTPCLLRTIEEVRAQVADERRAGRTIGLVPTMGALHAGHGALIDAARAGAGFVVVSVFVNPTQFDRRDDFEAYARSLESDVAFCGERGAHAVFAPSATEIYPPGHSTFVEVTGLQDPLCGRFRPGHFRGVATVVAKLFGIVQPDRAWFGEKDAQQLAIIRRMTLDLNLPVAVESVATVRDADGRALSSRNQRLNPDDRQLAPALFRALRTAQAAIAAGCTDPAAVREAALAELRHIPRIEIEYFEIVDPETLQVVARIDGPVLIALAAWLGGVRLIDNVRAFAPAAG
jgi:pantoate--beta-alanine ligase